MPQSGAELWICVECSEKILQREDAEARNGSDVCYLRRSAADLFFSPRLRGEIARPMFKAIIDLGSRPQHQPKDAVPPRRP